jgi:hypothetical protein
MQDPAQASPRTLHREPWNKGKLIGAKPPLRSKHVWSIRTKLQVEGQTRDLAMFNLAIDSKLRGCDVVVHLIANLLGCGLGIMREVLPLPVARVWWRFEAHGDQKCLSSMSVLSFSLS